MSAVIPLGQLRTQTIESLLPGSLFYTMQHTLHSRFHRLRVELDEAHPVGMVTLDDDGRFNLSMVKAGDAQSLALHVPAENLHVRLGMAQVADPEVFAPGNLIVTPEDALIVLRLPLMGGAYQIAYLSTTTWHVVREHPQRDYTVFTVWELVARNGEREDVLISVGQQ